MTTEELSRLKKAETLLADITKYEKQAAALSNCDKVKIFGHTSRCERVDFDITKDHPFYNQACDFIASYYDFLTSQIEIKQKEFNEL